ncbi:hypothetical protein H9657_10910 [Cellulomonas sp. Sa3CUA2]|uniref:Glycosyltransferase 2-like domain-containing protein n=1 Tax=Cellulomonas avistercoris TaxID=2762242 RepID=A0ABR8QEI5_9CELL|nr:hypothetical protein [Cellulomonas avistercoris]MBD7918781.1 hypothetical protein [Cellulomonas avistercoris]
MTPVRDVVAIVVPVTGPRAAWGALVPPELAGDDDVLVLDDRADPARSAELAAELARDTRVHAVVGHFSSLGARRALESYGRSGAVRVSLPLASAPDVTVHHQDRRLGVVAPMPSDREQVAAVRRHVAEQEGDAVAVVLSEHGALPRLWTQAGGRVVTPAEAAAGSAEHVVVLGELDDTRAAWPTLSALVRSGRRVVLSDDAWVGAAELAHDAGGVGVDVVTTQPDPGALVRAACEHARASLRAGHDASGFVDSWSLPPARWVVTAAAGARG